MFTKYLIGLIVLATIAFCFSPCVQAAEARRMSVQTLNENLANPSYVIIDVRKDSDWESSDIMIKGAVRENPNQVSDWSGKYSKDKKILLYCA